MTPSRDFAFRSIRTALYSVLTGLVFVSTTFLFVGGTVAMIVKGTTLAG